MRYTLAACWDGGKTWKARFAPPAREWSWSSPSQDPGLIAAAGKINVVEWTEVEKQANPASRGFIRVSQKGPRAGRYFEYADGTPFLWIGDTWWNWTKRGILFSSFQRLADDRVAKGFTVGQVFFSPNGLLNRTYGGRLKVDLRPSQATDRFEYTWFDLEQSRERTRGKVNGGAAAEFHTLEDYPGNLLFKDRLLLFRRAEL